VLTRFVGRGSHRQDVVVPAFRMAVEVLGVDPVTPAILLVERTAGGLIAHQPPDAPFSDAPPACWPAGRTGVVERTPERHYQGAWCPVCFGGAR
jgi:hypothetical protein